MSKSVVLSGTDTATIWTPASGKRICLTGIAVSKYMSVGTVAFYFEANTKIACFYVGTSATISPVIGPMEHPTPNGTLKARISASGTDDCYINVQGFELD